MISPSHSVHDFVWVFIGAVLVFTMQFGFMYVETGLSQAKHSINVAVKNLSDFVIAVISFWVVGFGLMFGDSIAGMIGFSGFFPGSAAVSATDIDGLWILAFFVFQATFAGTATTINSGATAGRTRFSAYLILSLLVSALIYPVFGHWAWGSLLGGEGGWLEALGFKDFAGSTVVHSVGGWVGLVTIAVLGPRQGKFAPDGTVKRIPPYSLSDTIMGTLILFFGWFGFNCGSTLEATPLIAPIAFNTMLGACFGALAAGIMSRMFSDEGRVEVDMVANGLLGGLVGITAGCAYISALGAAVIGFTSGCVVFWGIGFVEQRLRLDDVAGAVSVHGFCGAWGTLLLGFFDVSQGLFYGGGAHLLLIQTVGVLACFAWTVIVTYTCVKGIDLFGGGMRVAPEEEQMGLNIAEHGARKVWYEALETMEHIVASGDFTRRVPVEEQTEAGEVAGAFNRLMDYMQELVDVTEKVARGDLESVVAPRSPQDTLGHALKSMMDGLRAQERDLRETVGMIERMIETGDLSTRLDVGHGDRLGSLKQSVNAFFMSLDERCSQMKRIAEGDLSICFHPRSASDTLGVAARDMLENLRSMIFRINEAGEMIDTSSRSLTGADTGGLEKGLKDEVLDQMDRMLLSQSYLADAVKELDEKRVSISGVAERIAGIANQTNILALNASIEAAARAGDAGRGFSVVAREVKMLADKSMIMTREIETLTSSIGREIREAMENSTKTLSDSEASSALMRRRMEETMGGAFLKITTAVEHLGETVASFHLPDTQAAVTN